MKTTPQNQHFPVNDDEVIALNSLDFILLAVYFLAELDYFDFLHSLTLDILDVDTIEKARKSQRCGG